MGGLLLQYPHYSIIVDLPPLNGHFGRSVMAMRFMNGLTGIMNALSTPHALKVMVETLGFQHLDLDPWISWMRSGSGKKNLVDMYVDQDCCSLDLLNLGILG